MKIFIILSNEQDAVGEVTTTHFAPELLSDKEVATGIITDATLPGSEEKFGKRTVLCYNTTTNEFFNKFVDRPLTDAERVIVLQESLKTADEKYRELNLDTVTVEEARNAKMGQLDEICNKVITDGFDMDINGKSYRFSCSLSAQANFQGTDTLFKDGVITEVEWTAVNNETATVERVTLDQETFNKAKLQVFLHINSNIGKLRNDLQQRVTQAQTPKEVDLINW